MKEKSTNYEIFKQIEKKPRYSKANNLEAKLPDNIKKKIKRIDIIKKIGATTALIGLTSILFSFLNNDSQPDKYMLSIGAGLYVLGMTSYLGFNEMKDYTIKLAKK